MRKLPFLNGIRAFEAAARAESFAKAAGELNVTPAAYGAWSRAEQVAFWLNAYNAIVLRTIINAYPIQGKAGTYPAGSIRQIPGAFEQAKHRLACRTLTLDEI